MSRNRESERRIFVGNLPRDVREREIEDIFYKYGKIKDVNIRSSKNRGPAFAFVEFDDHRDAHDAIRGRDGYDFDGFHIRVEASTGGSDGPRSRFQTTSFNSGRGGRNPPKRSAYRVHVSNLPASGSWQDLKDHMRQAGDVLFADVYKDGTAVVEFLKYEDMKVAMETLQDSTFKSHEKDTSVIHLKEEYAGSSRGGSRSSRSRSRSRSSPSNKSSRSRSVSKPIKERKRSPSQHSSHKSVSRSISKSKSRSISKSRSLSREKSVEESKSRSLSKTP